MNQPITMTRIEGGLYKSRDGRVVITKVVSKQTRRADETCWQISIDGKTKPLCEDTYKEAKIEAGRLLRASERTA